MGFYNDISRSWVIGERRPTSVQATLLDISSAQIAHNVDLLRPGMSFVELASKAYRLPDAYLSNRYADLAHGCGLGVEYPFVLYPEDADDGMYDGRFEANMIVCVESYTSGLRLGRCSTDRMGVKLEQPVLITPSTTEHISPTKRKSSSQNGGTEIPAPAAVCLLIRNFPLTSPIRLASRTHILRFVAYSATASSSLGFRQHRGLESPQTMETPDCGAHANDHGAGGDTGRHPQPPTPSRPFERADRIRADSLPMRLRQ